MSSKILQVSEVVAIKGMSDSERPLYFKLIATARKVTPEEVAKSYESLLEAAAEHERKDAARAENERKAKLLDTLRGDVEAFRLGTTAEDGSEHDAALLSEYRERATALGAFVILSAIEGDSLRFSVHGGPVSKTGESSTANASRGGGTGAGRPAKDAPQPFVDADTGERVVGPVTMWLKARVSEDRLKAANLLKSDGSLKASGSAIAALAVKANILRESPVEDESTAPANDSQDAATATTDAATPAS